VNNANLNVHFSIPVMSRAGRGGFSFSYALSYDSSMWMPSSGYWYPTQYQTLEWGWRGTAEAFTGYVTYVKTQGSCYHQGHGWEYYDIYTFGTYDDPTGTNHPINAQVSPGNTCPGSPPLNRSITATDGSGLKFAVSYVPYAQVFTPSGLTITPPLNSASPTSGSSSISDPNGNSITGNYSSSSAALIDTLGSTQAPTLTVTGSPTSSPMTYTYTGPYGNATVTVKYTNYTIQTNFGCPNIIEYNKSNVPLVTEIDLPDQTSYTFTYEATPGYSGDVTARIASVILPTGGKITYDYSGGSRGITCADGSTATLTRRVYPDGVTPQVWSYAHSESPAWTTSIAAPADPQGNSAYTALQFQGVYETQRDVYQSQGGTLEDTVNTCYNGASVPCNSTSITLPISNRTVQVTLPSLSPAKRYTTYNTYGSPLEVDEYDWGPALARKTVTTYDYNTSCGVTNVNVLNRPCTVKIYDNASNLKAQTTLTYDPNGNLTTEAHTNTGGSPSSISRGFSYGSYGVLTSATDFNNNSTGYSNFTCGNSTAFPQTVTLPTVGSYTPTFTLTWDCNGGVLTSIKDTNNNTTRTFAYNDPNFWRLREVDYPDQGKTTIGYNDTPLPFSISTCRYLSSSVCHQSTLVLDGLARVIHLQDNTAGTYVDTTYDNLGRVYTVSNPYASANDPTYGLTYYSYDALNRATSLQAPDGSTMSTTYPGKCATATDPASKVRTLCSDGLGRINSVTEDPNGLNYQTTYTYDALNDLHIVSQGSQTRTYNYDMLARLTTAYTPEVSVGATQCATTYGYDANGNVTSKVAPLANQGTSCTNTVTTTYAYDALNRLTSKTYSDSTPAAHYSYDEGSVTIGSWSSGTLLNTKGRLSHTTTGSAPSMATVYSYDAMGRPANFWQCSPVNCGSSAWAMTYTYDLAGDITSWVHPGGFTLTNTVNAAQQVTSIKSSLTGTGQPQYPAQSISYKPWGAVSQLVNGYAGSGVNAQETYIYNKRVEPWTIDVGTTANAAADYCLVYNYYSSWTLPSSCPATSAVAPSGTTDNGSVMAYWYNDGSRPVSSHTATYSYDSLNRLSGAVAKDFSNNTFWSQTYSYDRWGNMSCSGTGLCTSMSYSSSNNNQLASVGGASVSYDAAGNLTQDLSAPHTYQWDAEGRMRSIDSGTTASITFNALGQRVYRSTPSNSVSYWYDPAGQFLGGSGSGWWNAAIPFAGRLLAEYASGTPAPVYFDHPNILGSEQQWTDSAGNPAGEVLFYPWGAKWGDTTNGNLYQLFASLLWYDPETDGYQAAFRYDIPRLGRWLTPDPLGGRITNPQSLNRYAYVVNNPTTLTDPLGLDGCNVWNVSYEGSGSPPWNNCPPSPPPGCDVYDTEPACDPGSGTPLPPSPPGGGGGGGGGQAGGGNPPPTGNPGSGGPTTLPPGVNAFLGFHIYCVQTKIGGVVNPANCALYFLGVPLNVFSLPADLSAAGLLIAGSVTGIVPAAYVGGAGPAVQLALSSQGWGCFGGGGAIGTVGKAFNFGPITGGDLGNARNVLSGWSVSTGWQSPSPAIGAQAMGNSSGWLYGPTLGTPGGSLQGTYSFCGDAPW
jgi:RHS repeat-associated protein